VALWGREVWGGWWQWERGAKGQGGGLGAQPEGCAVWEREGKCSLRGRDGEKRLGARSWMSASGAACGEAAGCCGVGWYTGRQIPLGREEGLGESLGG